MTFIARRIEIRDKYARLFVDYYNHKEELGILAENTNDGEYDSDEYLQLLANSKFALVPKGFFSILISVLTIFRKWIAFIQTNRGDELW